MFRIVKMVLAVLLPAALGACASAPVGQDNEPTHEPTAAAGSGMVIATLSCHFTDAPLPEEAPVLMRFERLDQGRPHHYTLLASMDGSSQRGLVTGPLPEGAYLLRDASVGEDRLAVGGLPMPFEVRRGEVTDLGHYQFSPANISAIYTGSRR